MKFVCFCCISAMNIFISLAKWEVVLFQRWIFFPSEVTCISDEFIQRWMYVHSELTSCFNSAVNFFFLARWQIRLCMSDEFIQRWIVHSEVTSCFISAVNFFPSEVTCISDEFIQRWIYVHSELTSCFNSAVNFFFLERWQIRLCISDEFMNSAVNLFP